MVSILRVIRLPRNPTVAFPDSQLPQQICGETRKHLLKATIKNHSGNKKERYRKQLSLSVAKQISLDDALAAAQGEMDGNFT